jgi:hypothetical protein
MKTTSRSLTASLRRGKMASARTDTPEGRARGSNSFSLRLYSVACGSRCAPKFQRVWAARCVSIEVRSFQKEERPQAPPSLRPTAPSDATPAPRDLQRRTKVQTREL